MKNRLVNRYEVLERCHFSCATLYRLMRLGHFPTPIRIGIRAVRWHESEIETYIAQQPRAEGNGR